METAECPCRHRRFQGRHPDQTLNALGAASNQLGPRVLAFGAQLKYEYGLSFGKVQRLLFDLLHRRRNQLTPHGFKVQRGKIEAALNRLLEKNLTDSDNARLARRLKKHRNHIFTYLHDETGETDPTNNLAEREIRPGVITRRNGACNRSPKGARATAILTSVIRTGKKNDRDVIEVLVRILCSPGRIVVELARPP